MKLLDKLRSSTMWLMVPTVAVACAVGLVVAGYDPLTFDPSLVEQAQAAQSANLKIHDAAEEATGTVIAAGTPAPADAVRVAPVPKAEGLADGTWTGYAVCGRGNGDGWKPYYVAVTIQVKGGKVTGITNVQGTSNADSGAALAWDAAENQSYLNWAISGRNGQSGAVSQINGALAAGRSLSGVDAVSGATYSSVAIYNAYAAAVNKAAKAGGSKAKVQPEQNKGKTKSGKGKGKKPKAKKTVSADDQGAVKDAKLADGTWIGYAACGEGNDEEWAPYYVRVAVTVKGGKVVGVGDVAGASEGEPGNKVLSWNESENKAYLDWAANGRTRKGVDYAGVVAQISAALEAGSYPASVDVVSGATYSSESIFRAFYAALRKSAAAGGVAVEDPQTPSGDDPEPSRSSGSDDPSAPSGDAGEDPGEKGDEPGGDPGDDPAPGGDDPQPQTKLVDGTYSSYAFCRDDDDPKAYSPYYIFVDIEVADGKVAKIANVYADETGAVDPRYRYDSSENATYLNFAIKGVGKRVKGMMAKIQEALDAGQDASSVDTVSSATWSSKAIQEAFNKAVASVPEEQTGQGEPEQDSSAEEGRESEPEE